MHILLTRCHRVQVVDFICQFWHIIKPVRASSTHTHTHRYIGSEFNVLGSWDWTDNSSSGNLFDVFTGPSLGLFLMFTRSNQSYKSRIACKQTPHITSMLLILRMVSSLLLLYSIDLWNWPDLQVINDSRMSDVMSFLLNGPVDSRVALGRLFSADSGRAESLFEWSYWPTYTLKGVLPII